MSPVTRNGIVYQDGLVMAPISELMESFARIGPEKDVPEGTRYVQVSDALWNDMIAKIREMESRLFWAEYDNN